MCKHAAQCDAWWLNYPEITLDFARESRGDLLRNEGVRVNYGNVTSQASILTTDVYNR